MMDISHADKPKLTFRILVGIAQRKLKKSINFAHDDMLTCANPAFRKPYLKVMEAAGHIRRYHHKSILADFGGWLLWVVYKDTAYNPVSLWILKELIDDKEFCKSVREQAVEPSEWYVNKWVATKEHTENLRKEGKLGRFALADDENIYVPALQHQKLKKMKRDYDAEIDEEINNMLDDEFRKRKK